MKQEKENNLTKLDYAIIISILLIVLSIGFAFQYQTKMEKKAYKQFCENKGYEYMKHDTNYVTCIEARQDHNNITIYAEQHAYRISEDAGTINPTKK